MLLTRDRKEAEYEGGTGYNTQSQTDQNCRTLLPKWLSTGTKNRPKDLVNEREWNLFFLLP